MSTYFRPAVLLLVLLTLGCNDDKTVMPTLNTEGRVVGTVNGVVRDMKEHPDLSG